MIQSLSKNWWLLLLRGLFAMIFGLMAISWPGATILAVALVFGAYSFIDGIAALSLGLTQQESEGRVWPLAALGICGIAAGVFTFIYPGITILVLLAIVSTWAILRGIFEIVLAVRLRKAIEGEWIFGFSGALSVIFGVLLFIMPAAGLVALVWLTAFYAIFFGIFNVALGLKLREFRHEGGLFEREPRFASSSLH